MREGVRGLGFSKPYTNICMKTITKLLAFTLIASVSAHAGSVIEKSVKGNPDLKKLDCLSFAPEGVLLVGDARNARIVAIATGDTSPASGQFKEVKGIRGEIAGRLGVKAGDIEVTDMAVNPASGKLYLAVHKQDDKTYVLLRLAPGGEIENIPLDNLEYASVPLPQGEKAPVNTITDVVWAGDRLVAAGRCNEEFASKIFAAEGPLHHDRPGQIYSAETYHISHRKWETRAPMSVLIPYEEDGKHYIVGAFSCTPVVKYPIDAVEPGAKIKGISMIELGSGNRPLDMFSYDKEGKSSVLTNTYRFHHGKRPYGPSPHLAFRFDELLLSENEVNEEAVHRLKAEQNPNANKIQIAEPFHGVVQMDRLNDKTALALRESQDKDFDLVAIELP